MQNQLTIDTDCLCGSALTYGQCCGAFHQGSQFPETAEALMRSRFTAYAMHNTAYLLKTWAANTRPKSLDLSNETGQWLRLQIVECKKGGIKNAKGLVEFNAFYSQDGEEHIMSEISRFIRQQGRWLYLDGVVNTKVTLIR